MKLHFDEKMFLNFVDSFYFSEIAFVIILSSLNHTSLMSLSIRKQYFSCLVQPVMDYGCVIWGNCSRDLLIKVHKIMKMYARSILDSKDKRQSSPVKLFQTLGWMPADVHIHYFTGIHMYNIIHGNAPSYLNEIFKTKSNAYTQYQK